MLDIHTLVRNLKRPGLLVRAARFGLDDYRRERDLPRALKAETAPGTGDALMQLLDIEAEIDALRRGRAAEYRPGRHIAVLVAIMGEIRTLQTAYGPRPVT